MAEQNGRTVRGATIRALRERALLSQEELAHRSGVSVRTVRNIETDRVARPHAATIRRIATTLASSGTLLPLIDVAQSRGTDRSTVPAPAIHQLPFDAVDFVGRKLYIEQLRTLLGDACGAAGDLGWLQPEAMELINVLGRFLRALGTTDSPPEDVDKRAALYRSVMLGGVAQPDRCRGADPAARGGCQPPTTA